MSVVSGAQRPSGQGGRTTPNVGAVLFVNYGHNQGSLVRSVCQESSPTVAVTVETLAQIACSADIYPYFPTRQGCESTLFILRLQAGDLDGELLESG